MLSVGVLSGAALSVSADTNSEENINCPFSSHKKENRQAKRENHNFKKHHKNPEIIEAIKNEDYTAWKEAINSQPRITDIINSEEKFNQLIQAHNLMKEGNYKEAKIIKESLGFEKMSNFKKSKNINQ